MWPGEIANGFNQEVIEFYAHSEVIDDMHKELIVEKPLISFIKRPVIKLFVGNNWLVLINIDKTFR